jgi:hypothetical protein
MALRVQEFSTSNTEDYLIHEVLLCRAGDELATGGYITKRDERGRATSGAGEWWTGICWSTDSERGPYPTLAAAGKAVKTGQVLTATLRARGFRA